MDGLALNQGNPMPAWFAVVAELHRRAGEGSTMERALLWFLFWPLLVAIKGNQLPQSSARADGEPDHLRSSGAKWSCGPPAPGNLGFVLNICTA